MAGHRDYYAVLGVGKAATQQEIQKAYRRLARKYHPDVNHSADAEERFKGINEAHDVLKDQEKRKLYDTHGVNWKEAQQYEEQAEKQGWRRRAGTKASSNDYSHTSHHFEAEDMGDFFSSLFGDRFSGGFEDPESAGRTVEAVMEITLHEMYYGGKKTIVYETPGPGGRGRVKKTLQVNIPRGLKDGSVIRLSGQGEEARGGKRGDLLLKIKTLADPRFGLDEYNLVTTVAIAPWEAALGAHIDVQTFEGQVSMSIPKGCQTGRKFRLKGKGLPRKTGEAGDLIVVVEIRIPEQLSDEERLLFQQLAQQSRFTPRAGQGQRAADLRQAV